MSRNVYNSIDITKFLMAILVIAIHTTNLQNCNTYWIQNVFYNVADMAVPFFFVCSSFFLSIKCQDIEQTERKIKIVNNYFWRIMRLYLLWNLVYFPFAIYGFVKNRDSLTTAIAKYIVDLVFKGEHYYSWPLWYLLAIIYSSILLCFLLKRNCKKENFIILLIILFIVGQMIDYGVDNSLFGSNVIYKLVLTIGGGRIFRGIGYYMFGWIISKYDFDKNRRAPPILLIVFVIISIATYKSFVWYYIKLVSPALLFVTVLNIKFHTNFRFLRYASTVMYFTHMIPFFVYSRVKNEEFLFGFSAFLIAFVCTIVFSLVIYRRKENELSKLFFS